MTAVKRVLSVITIAAFVLAGVQVWSWLQAKRIQGQEEQAINTDVLLRSAHAAQQTISSARRARDSALTVAESLRDAVRVADTRSRRLADSLRLASRATDSIAHLLDAGGTQPGPWHDLFNRRTQELQIATASLDAKGAALNACTLSVSTDSVIRVRLDSALSSCGRRADSLTTALQFEKGRNVCTIPIFGGVCPSRTSMLIYGLLAGGAVTGGIIAASR